jgi:hypothetical protein
MSAEQNWFLKKGPKAEVDVEGEVKERNSGRVVMKETKREEEREKKWNEMKWNEKIYIFMERLREFIVHIFGWESKK